MPSVTRRDMINMSFKSFIGLSAALPLLNSCSNLSETSVKNLSWNNFIEQIHELAVNYENPGFDEEAYLKKISKMTAGLNLNDRQITKFYANYQNRKKAFPEFTKMHKGQAFQVTLLEFEPGEKIPLHDHPDMCGVILCTSGDIHVENFDLLTQKSDSGNMLLKQTANVRMIPGTIGSLSSKRDNIHCLEAKEFTRLIDIFTPPYDKRRIEESNYFVKSKKFYKGKSGLFESVFM